MNYHICDALFVAIYAILYSALEIEIEAQHGWAAKLPTVPMFGTRFTGYHILMNITVIMSLLYALIPRGFLYSIFFITAWFLIEDLCWFIISPFYGLGKYNKENIKWHGDNWPIGIPIHNYIGILIMLTCAVLAGDSSLLISGFVMIFCVIISIILTPTYHKIYKKSRENKKYLK